MIIKQTTLLILSSFFLVQCSTLSPSYRASKAVGENAVLRKDNARGFDVGHRLARDPASQKEVSTNTDLDYKFALAETYSLEGDSQRAIDGFREVLLLDPESVTVQLKLALEYIKLGMVSEAVKYAESVEKKDPKNIEAKLLLGGLYSTLKLYEKALASYQSVIALDPTYESEATLYMGAIHAEKNDLPKALSFFNKVAKSPDTKFRHLAYYYLGRIHTHMGKTSEAEKSYKLALKSKRDFLDALTGLGALYEENNQEQKAIQLYANYQRQVGPDLLIAKTLSHLYLQDEQYALAYEQYEIILAQEPMNLTVKIRMALIDIERKEYDLAIRRLKEILAIAPDSDKVRFYLAAVLEEMSLYDEAIDNFLKIPAESSFYGDAITHTVYLYRAQKQTRSAETLIDQAIKNRADLSQFYAIKASILDERRQYEQAVILLHQASQLFPENEQLLFFLGATQDKLGQKKETVESMKKVLSLNDSHAQAMNYLAYTYAELGENLGDAEGLAKQALNLQPNDAFIVDTLGWIYFKQGKHKEAVEYLEKAHSLKPDEGVIAEHLGDVYFKIQIFTKAQEMYERAARVEKNEDNQRKLESKIIQIKKFLGDNPSRVPASSI